MDALASIIFPLLESHRFRQAINDTIASYPESLAAYTFNVWFGLVCIAVTVVNLFVLIKCQVLSNQNFKLPIALAVSYLISLCGLITEAYYRKQLYLTVLKTMRIPIVSSRDCLRIGILLQITSDFWVPTVAIPSVYAVLWPTDDVKYMCGRRATYFHVVAYAAYSFNIFGFTLAFLMNLTACFKARFGYQQQKASSKLIVYTLISFLSTLFVSIPSLLSIFTALGIPCGETIRRLSVPMAAMNTSGKLRTISVCQCTGCPLCTDHVPGTVPVRGPQYRTGTGAWSGPVPQTWSLTKTEDN
uniref:G_PROTEIN_RECEP_F1_2 domain-containing protein n=1 Tax=Panagrellus redivivus TaxID=6233 RepID=A0A7E4VJH7_PANRE